MIDKTLLLQAVEEELSQTDGFLVSLTVTPDRKSVV